MPAPTCTSRFPRLTQSLCAALLLASAGPAGAQQLPGSRTAGQPTVLQQVGLDQRLDAQVPLDLTFLDEQGRRTTIGECLSGRAAILVLAYYQCPMLCNQVLNGMARSVHAVDLEPGRDFEIVVVSIDPLETPALAASKKRAVLRAFHSGSKGEGWHFLTSDGSGRGPPGASHTSTGSAAAAPVDPDVAALSDAVGYRYAYDPASGQYAHASGIMLLTPEGRVSRYFYGIDYPTRDLRLSLVEASRSTIGSPVDALMLYCFHYDPLTGRYGVSILRMLRAGGIATVAAMAGFIGLSLRRERLRNRQSAAAGATAEGAAVP